MQGLHLVAYRSVLSPDLITVACVSPGLTAQGPLSLVEWQDGE
jgi:hypothetical protein